MGVPILTVGDGVARSNAFLPEVLFSSLLSNSLKCISTDTIHPNSTSTMNLSELVQVYGSKDGGTKKGDENPSQSGSMAKKTSATRAPKPKRTERGGGKPDRRHAPMVFPPPAFMPAIPGSYPYDPSFVPQYAPPMVRVLLFSTSPF